MVGVWAFIILFSAASASCAETVKYTAIIYRHGDRTPVDTYPTDPWRNESLWPVKFGELTNTGKRQHYALGQWFRKRYSHLLSEQFDPIEIYVRSTDVDRTLMSAQANLAGLYPPIGNSVWNENLLWQPIPIHTKPELDDELLAMKKPCPAFDRENERYIHSKAYKVRLSKYQSLMDYLTAYSGIKVKSYQEIVNIYSILFIENLYNFTLPNWTHSVFPDKMAEPAGYSFTDGTATPLMARLKVGPLMRQIIANMFSVMSEKKHKKIKMSMYSGHDYTIGSVLNALGMYDGVCPAYTSTIIMDLIYDNTTMSHSIQISYRNSTEIVEPVVLTIPHCGKKCPVSRFIKLYENLLSVDWDRECNKQFPPLLGISFFVGLGLFMLIYVAHKTHFARVSRDAFDMRYTTIHSVQVTPIKSPATTPE